MIDFGCKKMILLTKKELKSLKTQKNVRFVENFIEKFEKYKNNQKSRGYFHYADKNRGAAHSIFNL